MKEALLLGVASVVLGVVLGIEARAAPAPGHRDRGPRSTSTCAPDVRLTPSAASIATAVALGIGATLLAAWLPAFALRCASAWR
jgi:ABC-type antimicrobial peptide transport system permease subunit